MALGKQNMSATCPKDKLELLYFLSPEIQKLRERGVPARLARDIHVDTISSLVKNTESTIPCPKMLTKTAIIDTCFGAINLLT